MAHSNCSSCAQHHNVPAQNQAVPVPVPVIVPVINKIRLPITTEFQLDQPKNNGKTKSRFTTVPVEIPAPSKKFNFSGVEFTIENCIDSKEFQTSGPIEAVDIDETQSDLPAKPCRILHLIPRQTIIIIAKTVIKINFLDNGEFPDGFVLPGGKPLKKSQAEQMEIALGQRPDFIRIELSADLEIIL